ncbi:MAG: hypothetical protein M1365_05425 [Actinobacteria bacterium]|nr:hypothetical protein [Actinomycetota bacterium]
MVTNERLDHEIDMFVNYEDYGPREFWKLQIDKLSELKNQNEGSIKHDDWSKKTLISQINTYRHRPWYTRWIYWLFTDIEERGQTLAGVILQGHINKHIDQLKNVDKNDFPSRWETKTYTFSKKHQYYLSFLSTNHVTYFTTLFRNLRYYWHSAKNYFKNLYLLPDKESKDTSINLYEYTSMMPKTTLMMKAHMHFYSAEQKHSTNLQKNKQDALSEAYFIWMSLSLALGVSTPDIASEAMQGLEDALKAYKSKLSEAKIQIILIKKMRLLSLADSEKNKLISDKSNMNDILIWLESILGRQSEKFNLLQKVIKENKVTNLSIDIKSNKEYEIWVAHYKEIFIKLIDNLNLLDKTFRYWNQYHKMTKDVDIRALINDEFITRSSERNDAILLNKDMAEISADYCGLVGIKFDPSKDEWIISLDQIKKARRGYMVKIHPDKNPCYTNPDTEINIEVERNRYEDVWCILTATTDQEGEYKTVRTLPSALSNMLGLIDKLSLFSNNKFIILNTQKNLDSNTKSYSFFHEDVVTNIPHNQNVRKRQIEIDNYMKNATTISKKYQHDKYTNNLNKETIIQLLGIIEKLPKEVKQYYEKKGNTKWLSEYVNELKMALESFDKAAHVKPPEKTVNLAVSPTLFQHQPSSTITFTINQPESAECKKSTLIPSG